MVKPPQRSTPNSWEGRWNSSKYGRKNTRLKMRRRKWGKLKMVHKEKLKKRIYKLFILNRINQISELQSRRVSPRETSPAFVHRSNEGETSEVPKNARIDAISPSNIWNTSRGLCEHLSSGAGTVQGRFSNGSDTSVGRTGNSYRSMGSTPIRFWRNWRLLGDFFYSKQNWKKWIFTVK